MVTPFQAFGKPTHLRRHGILIFLLFFVMYSQAFGFNDAPKSFRVGFSKREITPKPGLPMWGYGARHDKPAEGTLDPLFARAAVVEAGDERLAIVSLDLGRGPTQSMMDRIRRELSERASIRRVFIVGTHTHHGPVIELTDRPGFGKGKFDLAVRYAEKLPDQIVVAVLDAEKRLQPARVGSGAVETTLNRNRQAKKDANRTDPLLQVVRFDDENGKPILILVNFAAHPVLTDGKILKYSADYPGFLVDRVERELGAPCLFLQGASGDLSPNAPAGKRNPKDFGEAVADVALNLARTIETKRPENPKIVGKTARFHFESRVDLDNPAVRFAYGKAFFPELTNRFAEEFHEKGVPVESSTALINDDIAIVGVSGECFCRHATRLRERTGIARTLFLGYCNGHSLYLPTIEAIAEGGYGADPPVAPAKIGAGEEVLNRALIDLFELQGKMPASKDHAKESRVESPLGKVSR